MPKIVSDREKDMIAEAIYKSTLELIKEKGLRGVTVDDIAQSANIAKGSFYKYYQSKEVCLYEVIKRSESEIFGRLQAEFTQSKPSKELIDTFLHEVYIADNSLVLYITPKDAEALMRKLPVEYAEREQEKSVNYFEQTLHLLGIGAEIINMGVLTHLMDSLAFIASKRDNQTESKEAMKLIINTIAEYLSGGITQ